MKITKLASASALALLALSTSAPVLAAEGDPATPQTATSEGRIGLVSDPNQDHPGDIDDDNDGHGDGSDKPGDKNGNDSTGQTGELTLDAVPNYDFGIQNIENDDTTYNALYWDATAGAVVKGRNSNPYVQVTDLRADNTGWNVTVAMTSTFKTDSGKELSGVILALPQGKATPTDTTNTSGKPAISEVKEVNSKGSLLMNAAKTGDGAGTWADVMFDDKTNNKTPTTLTVPGKKSAGNYKAELTWTLADAPAS